MKKKILNRTRIRTIQGGFAFIPHRFLTDGFLRCLEPTELLLYLFLTLVSDAHGISYYGDSAICRLLKTNPMDLKQDRHVLISHDLIAYDPPFYQVLELPFKSQTANAHPESQSHSSTPSSFSQLIKRMEN